MGSGAECEQKTLSNLDEFSGAKRRNQRSYLAPGDSLNMVQIDRTVCRHAITATQEDFGRNVSNGRCDGRDSDFSQKFQGGVSGQNHHWPTLIRLREPVPSHIASLHSSPQFCSFAQALNSPGRTGFRA
jgi:hypothetical protein